MTEIKSFRVDSYSQSILTGLITRTRQSNDNTNNNQISDIQTTQMIEIYNDKELTQKLLSFDNVDYSEHIGNNGVVDGLLFETKNSNSAIIGQNYFFDKGTKQSDTAYLVRFTSFNKCNVNVFPRPTMNYDVVSIGLLDKEGKATYMSLTYGPTDKQDKKQIAEKIGSLCKENIDGINGAINDFWKEVQLYWKLKGQVQKTGDNIKQMDEENNKENDVLSQVSNEKKNFENSLSNSEKSLNATKSEMDAVSKKLKESYKKISELKERKVKNEKNLTDLNNTLKNQNNETNQTQAQVQESNKRSDDMRKKSDDLINQISKAKEELNELDKSLVKENEIKAEIDTDIAKLNKEISKKGANVAQLNKDIKTNKDLKDGIALDDLQNNVDKNLYSINEAKRVTEKNLNETAQNEHDILKGNETIRNSQNEINKTLSDPKVIKETTRSIIRKNKDLAKKYFDNLKGFFHILPPIFMQNLWEFINIDNYEGMNYIQSIRPSYFSLYDHLYSANTPKRKALGESSNKRSKRRFKKKMKKHRKMKLKKK